MEKTTRAGLVFNWPTRDEGRRHVGRRRCEEKHGGRGYSKRNKARGPWPSSIDHLHRQISSVLCDESLFIQQSNNRFRSDFEPPRAECTPGRALHIHTRSSGLSKIRRRANRGYNVSISSRATVSVGSRGFSYTRFFAW